MERKALEVFQRYLRLATGKPSFDQMYLKHFDYVKVSPQGNLFFSLQVSQEICDYNGFLHAGALTTVLDAATGMSLWMKLEEAKLMLAATLNVNFIGNPKIGDKVIIESKCNGICQNIGHTYAEALLNGAIIGTASNNICIFNRVIP
ncbi:unnamed protein product [Blepharisma stoltei]|uniref:Thioesterase domain-containing protein n=1 Tax=Blepharisma stoltei TaxID=1481888 RepID=A0AAU9IGG5_9CILI|nr:unnamed protein product [Blepharisma stoltei]